MKTVRLGDISSLVTSGSRGWGAYYSESGAVFLRMTNLPKHGIRLLWDSVKYVELPEGSKEGQRTKVERGDVLISITAELGKIGFVEDELNEAYVNQHVCLVRIASPVVDPCYVAYFLASTPQRNLFQRLNDSGAKAALNLKAISSFPISLPPLPEQKAIAETLSTWDRAIEKLDRLIAAKEKRFEGLVQECLTSKETKLFRLQDLIEEHGQKSDGSEEVFSVSVHKGLVNQVEHLGRVFAAKDTSNYNRVMPGDLVYTKSPTGDFPYGIIKMSRVEFPVIVSPLYGVFTPQSSELGEFLDAYFESPIRTANFLRPLIQKGAKNTMNITNRGFLTGKLVLPVKAEDIADISMVLDGAKSEINLLKQQADATRRQKRGLMQKLLTGEWRVGIMEGHGRDMVGHGRDMDNMDGLEVTDGT
jgi:type I restriction enzyme S subunit